MGASGDDRPDLAGGREELRRLAADHGEVVVLGGRGVLGGGELHHLAFGDHGRRRRTGCRGARSEPTSTIMRKAWPSRKSPTSTLASLPHSMRAAELAAAHVALVDHVVVEQGGGVHELDRGGELDMAVALIAGELAGGERQHRAQALAAGGDEVVGHLRDHRRRPEPVRDRIIALTRSISEATRDTSFSMLAFCLGMLVFERNDDALVTTRVAGRDGR